MVCLDGARRPRGRHRASNGVATRRLLGAVRQRLRRQCLRALPRLLRCLHGRHRPGAGGGPPCGRARPVGPASQNMPANWPRLAEAGGRPELDLALAGRAGGRIGRSLRLPCTQVVFLTLMVVWVAVRLARLATVAKNLHSQRRFSAMQVSRPAHTNPRVRGAPPVPACVGVHLRAKGARLSNGRPTPLVRVCRADAGRQLRRRGLRGRRRRAEDPSLKSRASYLHMCTLYIPVAAEARRARESDPLHNSTLGSRH